MKLTVNISHKQVEKFSTKSRQTDQSNVANDSKPWPSRVPLSKATPVQYFKPLIQLNRLTEQGRKDT